MFVIYFRLLLFDISNSIYQVFLSNANNFHIAVWFQIIDINPLWWLNFNSLMGPQKFLLLQDREDFNSNGN